MKVATVLPTLKGALYVIVASLSCKSKIHHMKLIQMSFAPDRPLGKAHTAIKKKKKSPNLELHSVNITILSTR